MPAAPSFDRAISLGAKCDLCPFRDDESRPVFPSSTARPLFAIVGEGPGRNEVREGRPFVGESGEFLNRILTFFNIPRAKLHVTNATLCRPTSRDPKMLKQARECCRPRLESELASLPKKLPILALGGEAMTALIGKRGIFDWCGGIYRFNDHLVVPTFHPAFVLRPDGRSAAPVLYSHVLRLWQLVNKTLKPLPEPRIIIEPGEEAIAALREIARSKIEIGFDVETRGKDPRTAPLMALGIASDTTAISMPWERYTAKGGETVKGIDEYGAIGAEIKNLCRTIIEDAAIPKVLQNGQHDILSCERLGWKFANYNFDTLLAHSVVMPGYRHDLGQIAAIEFAFRRWKSEFHVSSDAKGLDSFVKRDPHVLREYNATDAYVTRMLKPALETRLAETNNGAAIYRGYHERALVALKMRRRGVHVDVTKFARHRRRILRGRRKHVLLLREIASRFGWLQPPVELPEWRELSRRIARCRWVDRRASALLDVRGDDPKAASWRRARHKARKKRREYEKQRSALVSDPAKLFNPNASRCLNKLFFEQLAVIPSNFSHKTQAPSLDEDTLVRLCTHHNAIVAGAARSLLAYRRWSKLLSTYIDGMPLDEHNVVHPTWNVSGARTGRWSSQSPNVLAIPKPNERILKDGRKKYGPTLRDLFIAHDALRDDPHNVRGWVVEADKKQLELKVITQLAGDEPLLAAYARGDDVHRFNAADIFRIPKPEDVSKAQRNLSKIFVYAADYLGSAETIWKSIAVEFPNVTLLQVEQMMAFWFGKHPKIRKWHETMLRFAREHDYVELPLSGFRQKLWGLLDARKIVNTPVQGTAADIVNPEIIAVAKRLDWKHSGIMFQYHDALICDSPDPVSLIGILGEEMNRTIEINGSKLLYDVDFKLGLSWGDAVEVKNLKEVPELMRRLKDEAEQRRRDRTGRRRGMVSISRGRGRESVTR